MIMKTLMDCELAPRRRSACAKPPQRRRRVGVLEGSCRRALKAAFECQAALLMALSASSAEGANTSARSLTTGEPRRWSLTARWENDTFGDTDRFYTDGASLSLIHTGGGWLDPVANLLPWSSGRRCVGYDVGQIMVTPGDKLLSVPDPNDRPYAGILYAGISLHIDHGHSYHGWKFITGVVGPWSLAEVTQKQVHRWVDSGQPQGWDYQLHNEPIFNFVYEHRRKYRLLGGISGLAVEALPTGTVMLGNVLTQGSSPVA
jgi:lipid A 3-O-deacylase